MAVLAPAVTASRRSFARPTARKRRNVAAHVFLIILVIYFLMPLWWLFVASTKDAHGLFDGTGGALWFDKNFAFFDNVGKLFTYSHGIYLRWLGNSFLYALSGGVGATILAILAG
jgi:multiple sugar transport system permease protein